MTTFTLKNYQKEALGAFDEYLRQAQISGPRGAYELVTGGFGYNAEPFGDTPCVCLRIPTGGGKTLLAAHALPAEYANRADAYVDEVCVPLVAEAARAGGNHRVGDDDRRLHYHGGNRGTLSRSILAAAPCYCH